MALPDPPAPYWETIGFDGSQHEQVLLGDVQQRWWILEPDRGIQFSAPGPGPLRLDTRLLDPKPGLSPYVIEASLDGERLDWFKEETQPSGTWTDERWIIGKRKRVTIDLPDGVHQLEVRLVAPTDAKCLLRARYQADAVED